MQIALTVEVMEGCRKVLQAGFKVFRCSSESTIDYECLCSFSGIVALWSWPHLSFMSWLMLPVMWNNMVACNTIGKTSSLYHHPMRQYFSNRREED